MSKQPVNPAEELAEFQADARRCDQEVEAAIAESRAIDRREARLNDLVDGTLASFERFLSWQDRMHAFWSHSSTRYEPKLAGAMALIDAVWLKIFKVAMEVLDRDQEVFGIHPAQADRLRERYREMLSLALMDSGPMPEHIAESTRQAVEDFRAGRATEY